MINRLVGQFNIIGKAVLSSLAPALARLGLVLLGLILGLVWAYQFAPVQFKDAEPVHLADGYKDQWIKMTAVEYAVTSDRAEAERKIVAGGITPDMIQQLIAENQSTDPTLTARLQALLPVAEESQAAASKQADKVKGGLLSGILGPILFVLFVAIVGILLALVFTFYWAVPVGKWAKPKAAATLGAAPVGSTAARTEARQFAETQNTDFASIGEAPPLVVHKSIYTYGNDLYDDSFSIERESGEFLGECGSGISETVGVGEPKKVTATEVWLFDKNDITTVTKVLMSEYAYHDEALRSKLAPKGEAVLATPDGVFELETQTLRLRVKIVDLKYGEGGPAPNSYFERLSVEIAAWPKEGSASQETPPSDAFGDTAELLNY